MNNAELQNVHFTLPWAQYTLRARCVVEAALSGLFCEYSTSWQCVYWISLFELWVWQEFYNSIQLRVFFCIVKICKFIIYVFSATEHLKLSRKHRTNRIFIIKVMNIERHLFKKMIS